MSAWDGEPVPERKWAIRDRVPLNQAGLFSGEGGTGKSIIELMKDAAHVAGKDWLGSLPEPGPAFYIGAEDDKAELHIRLAAIAKHYHVTFKELSENGLHVLCLLGQDATLCAVSGKSGKVETTALYRQLYEAAGDMNRKTSHRHALARLQWQRDRPRAGLRIRKPHAGAGNGGRRRGHGAGPSQPGRDFVRFGISGSTAWHGAFRFRMYLKGIKPEAGEQPDSDIRELQFRKNQYGPMGEAIALRYQRGLFLPEPGMAGLDKIAAEQRANDLFLTLLAQFDKQGRNVSDKPTANGYAPTTFARESEAKSQGIRKTHLEAAMQRLFKTNQIRVENYGRPSRPASKLVAVPPTTRGG